MRATAPRGAWLWCRGRDLHGGAWASARAVELVKRVLVLTVACFKTPSFVVCHLPPKSNGDMHRVMFGVMFMTLARTYYLPTAAHAESE